MIKAKNLNVYIAEKLFFKEVNLNIEAGKVYHFIGPNGCGKTTLMEALIGLNKKIEGELINNLQNDDFGFLPQVSHQFPKMHLTLGDICSKEFSFYPRSMFEKHWHKSSGGERKKALIAKTLTEAGRLIILDEPFNHLDHETSEEVARVLMELNKNGMAIIYTGHEFHLEQSHCIEVDQWRC